jgi:general secretion pathway protein H
MADPRAGDAGVTLVEILVVLTLIAISAGIVSYALPSGAQARTLDQEAALLTARLNLAAERSLMNGRHYTLDWQAEGYAFQEWQDGAWRAATGAPLSEGHTLASGAVLSDDDGTRKGTVQITPDLLPGDEGVVLLWLDAGAVRRSVFFDGAAAGVAK